MFAKSQQQGSTSAIYFIASKYCHVTAGGTQVRQRLTRKVVISNQSTKQRGPATQALP
jgi:hypothetical protein